MKQKFLYLLFLCFTFNLQAQCMFSGFTTVAKYLPSSGYPDIDAAIKKRAADLSQQWNLQDVKIQYIEDTDYPNAYAYCEDQTINIGLSLIKNLNKNQQGPNATYAVLAHEYAHLLQCKKKCHLQNQFLELHADFLSGYYLAQIANKPAIEYFAKVLFQKGDYLYWSEQHHGTPDLRIRALREGYQAYEELNYNIHQAFDYGMRFVEFQEKDSGKAEYSIETQPIPIETWVKCDKCAGKGDIEIKQECRSCKGKPYNPCDNCGANGKILCNICKGEGRIACSQCHGKGGPTGWICQPCQNRGYSTCVSCGGKKGTICEKCQGAKKLTCNICNGKGNEVKDLQCDKCHGKGEYVIQK